MNDEWPHTDQNGRPTLRTVAALAGVSSSTASRVLSPGPKTAGRSTAAATQKRIRDVAQQVGYVANPVASGLRLQRSSLIGVLVPKLADLVLATIYEGIEAAASDNGFGTFVTNTRDDPATQRARADMMLNRRVDGLILADARVDGSLADQLRHQKVPYVLTNRRVEGHPSVTGDDVMGGRLAAEHLLSLGHHRVGVIAGEPYASTGIDRTRGFLDAYERAGLPVAPERVIHSRFDVQGGRQATDRLLRTGRDLTALFAVNDFAAIGAIGGIRDAGMTVGTDFAVVGYNDVPLAAELPIALTTVRSPMSEMGYQAMHMLIRRLEGEQVSPQLIPPVLVARSSTPPHRTIAPHRPPAVSAWL